MITKVSEAIKKSKPSELDEYKVCIINGLRTNFYNLYKV